MINEGLIKLKKYLKFRTKSKSRGGHGIHSPFVYDLYTKCIDTHEHSEYFRKIESLKKLLRRDHSSLQPTNFGAGSKSIANPNITIGKIAKQSSVSHFQGRLIYRLVKYFKPKNIIELGTSLGISTAYLSAGNSDSKVFSIEGDNAFAELAKKNLNKLGLNNVTVINGDFDSHLPEILSKMERVGLVFIDGNHTEEATIRYFQMLSKVADNDTLIIFDDIRWSIGMENAWNNICSDLNVSISIDLFNCGLVFFRKGVVKQHFNLRYGPF
jgi:predicted O-methyltransferase YrrM